MYRRIGITGGSGSGKGYVCSILREMGYPCIDTDSIVHALYVTNKDCISELKNEFGDAIFENDVLVRSKLAQIVFSDPEKLKILNTIVHRYVISECDNICKELFENGNETVFIDAPQLYEAGMEKMLDAVIAVIAPKDLRIKRIIKRDSISELSAHERIDNQHSDEFFKENADFMIENNLSSSDDELKKRLKEIITELGV